MTTRDSMSCDVIIVGAGPSGLACAIRLAQLAKEKKEKKTICVLEKGSEVGAHVLSGAVFEPRALEELLPNWKALGAPLHTPVTQDSFCFLTHQQSFRLPTPPQMNNRGNYVISLGNLCRWLAQIAESLGIQLFPGFPAKETLFDDVGKVKGVITGDRGIGKNGERLATYEPGIELHAPVTILAEGCRGSLAKSLMEKYHLNQNNDPQTYGLGVKELWEIDPSKHRPGEVLHTIGWPLDHKTYGGSFVYHLDNNQVSIGFVVGLDYQNPYLSPYEELQRFKHHPKIAWLLEGGRRVAYGARSLNEGGFQSLPTLHFPGGVLIGCSAGFLNVPKLKGSHLAMKSGMLAAESVFEGLETYPEKIKLSWIYEELYTARNIRPSFHYGLFPGLVLSAIDTYLFRGKAPWTLHTKQKDHDAFLHKSKAPTITYPKPDGKLSFDRLTSVSFSGTTHNENQPCHLVLKDNPTAITTNFEKFDSPEQRYCPAGVYEIVQKDNKPVLQINAPNCVHCKACDIKDPMQNITWTPPEGGDGPNYPNM